MCVYLRTASVEWNVPGKYRPHGELFFFLIKESVKMPGSETFSLFFAADIRTHFFPAYRHALNGGRGKRWRKCQTPDFGDTWRFGCPKSPMWVSERCDRFVPSGAGASFSFQTCCCVFVNSQKVGRRLRTAFRKRCER